MEEIEMHRAMRETVNRMLTRENDMLRKLKYSGEMPEDLLQGIGAEWYNCNCKKCRALRGEM